MQKIIILLSVVAFFASCSSSKKAVNINKAHKDSSVIESKNNSHTSNVDSTAKKTENKSYSKVTDNHFEPINIEPDYDIIDTIPLIVKNRKNGKQIIYMPVKTITENGSVTTYDSGHVVKNNDSTANEQKNTHLISDKKEVTKNKSRRGFDWWWLLLLIPTPLLSKKVRGWIVKIFIPIKRFL